MKSDKEFPMRLIRFCEGSFDMCKSKGRVGRSKRKERGVRKREGFGRLLKKKGFDASGLGINAGFGGRWKRVGVCVDSWEGVDRVGIGTDQAQG